MRGCFLTLFLILPLFPMHRHGRQLTAQQLNQKNSELVAVERDLMLMQAQWFEYAEDGCCRAGLACGLLSCCAFSEMNNLEQEQLNPSGRPEICTTLDSCSTLAEAAIFLWHVFLRPFNNEMRSFNKAYKDLEERERILKLEINALVNALK